MSDATASTSKSSSSGKKKKSGPKRDRRERRFVASGGVDAGIIRLMFAVGAMLLGAGAFGQFMRPNLAQVDVDGSALPALPPLPYAYGLLAAGALVTGVALWIGSSGGSAMRVGDAGVALEKGEIVRMAWNAIKELTWDRAARSVRLLGTDEMGAAVDWTFAEKEYGDGVGWILKEGRARLPQLLDLDNETADEVDTVSADAGELLQLEPLQVVGKRCAQCDGVLAYEPEGRVCPHCERVYHKAHVPEHCACGANIANLRPRKVAEAS